ncbi:MAG: AAA family ATPase [Ruminiclostridium sp.]
MKPVSVRFRCFGSFMEEQFIDFEEISKSGIFLINGETGSGKTTILDAICYSLYGVSSGGLRDEGLEVMRCKLAEKKDITLVEFVFDSGGERYKFTRSLKQGTKNLNEDCNCMRLEEGSFVPMLENPKKTYVNAKAEEIIGLDKDQFRQVIILPQGKFEQLLVAKDKAPILTSIFRAEKWDKIVNIIKEQIKSRKAALDAENDMISARLAGYGFEKTEELEALEKSLSEQLCTKQKEEKVLKEQSEREEALYRQMLVGNKDFEELDSLKKAFESLKAEASSFEQEELLLDKAVEAAKIKPVFDSYSAAAKQSKAALESAAKAEERLSKKREARLKAQAAIEEHNKALPEIRKAQENITIYSGLREVYRSLSEKKAAAEAAEKAHKTAVKEMERAEGLYSRFAEGLKRAMTEQEKAIEELKQVQQIYNESISGQLARELKEGCPCPVCGSENHPKPALFSEKSISKEELDDCFKAVNEAHERFRRAETAKKEAENKLGEEKKRAEAAAIECTKAKSEYESLQKSRIEGVDNSQQLEKEIERLTSLTEEYDRTGTVLSERLSAASADVMAAETELKNCRGNVQAAQKELEAQEKLWQEALSSSSFEGSSDFSAALLKPEEIDSRRQRITTAKTRLAAAREQYSAKAEALKEKERPDVALQEEKCSGLSESLKKISEESVRLKLKLAEASKDSRELQKALEHYTAESARLEEDAIFYEKLNPQRTGLNIKNYVLGVMLASIAAQANRLLKEVYGGRYQLYQTVGEKGKVGLELEVYDAENGKRRSVTTLSGGEKFFVALSLAIGLSAVVQAQGTGVRLEAMFVDEGFGTLDRETLKDAIGILKTVQETNGIVGIISHVESLAETIPARIDVEKGEKGSRCRMVTP